MDNNNTSTSIAANNLENNDNTAIVSNSITDITPADPTPSMDSNRQPPVLPEAQQEPVDMLLAVETVEDEDDDMPSLYEASFTDSDVENVALDANLGAQDRQIPTSYQTQQITDILSASRLRSTAPSTPAPPSSSTSSSVPPPPRSNRRARVEDDDDEDRDRRHPSQRVGNHNDQPSTPNGPFNPMFAPFFTSFRDAGAALGLGTGFLNRTPLPNSSESSTSNMSSSESNTNPTPDPSTSSSRPQNQGVPQNAGDAPNRRAPMHFLGYEFSIVIDGSGRSQPAQHQAPASNDPNVQGQQDGNTPADPAVADATVPPNPAVAEAATVPPNISFNPPISLGNLATLLGIPFSLPGGGFGFPQLSEEKEDPERARKLVDGLEKVPVGLVRRLERVGTGGGGMGEDESKGGDVGCAVCWDRLLPEELGQEKAGEGQECMIVDEVDTEEENSEPNHHKIVSLPCAHVFHADCLIPWFSRPRHTTCPTCRFNIDPENLTYVSATQRRQEQRAANNEGNDVSPPSEGIPGGPVNLGTTPATTDTNEQLLRPQEQQGGNPVIDLGGGFAGIIQMLNAQAQSQQQQPATAPVNDAAPSGAQPQAHGPVPLIMPMPLPVGGADNLFSGGFAGGQLPMPMPVPFMAVPLPPTNAQGVPLPWRMTGDPIPVATGGANPTNADNANTSGGALGANNANATPATTVNEPSTAVNPQPRPPTIIADVIRISVDMVFDGRQRRQMDQGPTNNSAVPQPAGGSTNPSQEAQNADQAQATADDTNDGTPTLLSLEAFPEFIDRIRRDRRNQASNGGGDPAAANDDSEHAVPQAQPAEPHPQHRDPHGFPLGGIHVAGSGRSLEEALGQALSRFQGQMAQPRQEDQPGDPPLRTVDENPPQPPQQTRTQPQGQGQRPWQFMPMPFMDFAMGPPQSAGPKRPWAPPPPPGPTLRQRIERRELEAGLRCHDVSCGLGPSDEDPLGEDISDTLHNVQQLSVMSNKRDEESMKEPVCDHKFHGACLVSAERVALRGAEAATNEVGGVEVSCPLCRASGFVTKEQWDEGVLALQ